MLFIATIDTLAFSNSTVVFPVIVTTKVTPTTIVGGEFSKLMCYTIYVLPSTLCTTMFFTYEVNLLALTTSWCEGRGGVTNMAVRRLKLHFISTYVELC